MKKTKQAVPISAQIDTMRRELRLGMPPAILSHCVAYFQNVEHRVSTPDELALLDRFSAILSKTRHAAALGELYTNDDTVVRTYQDLLQKRSALAVNTQKPPLLSELLEVAGAYLTRLGKDGETDAVCSVEEPETAKRLASTQSTLVTSDAPFVLRTLAPNADTMREGDLILLLSSVEGGASTNLASRLQNAFADEGLAGSVKAFFKIGELGLLWELLSLPFGTDLSAPRLISGGKAFLPALTDAYKGFYLMCVSQASEASVIHALLALGVRAVSIACLKHEDRITVLSNKQRIVDLSHHFLKALYLERPLTAKLGDESLPSAPIAHLAISSADSRYLDFPRADYAAVGVPAEGILTAGASCHPEESFFGNALDTALTSVLTLAASGAPFRTQRLAIGLSVPACYHEPACFGACVSTALGLYRAETELGLRAGRVRLSTHTGDDTPRLSVFSIAGGTPIPDTLSSEGAYVSLLTVPFGEDGLPDFEALRETLDFVTALKTDGLLRSFRVLAHERVGDALDAIKNDEYTYKLAIPDAILDRTPRLAVLCETVDPIEGEAVGRVVKADMELTEETDAHDLAPTDCLIPSTAPEIVLYTDPDDRDADLLEDELLARGANVTRLSSDDGSLALRLSRAILTSQILIVGDGASLPDDQSVKFALSTLLRANGRILFPAREKCPTRIKGIALPRGFSSEMLDQICNF